MQTAKQGNDARVAHRSAKSEYFRCGRVLYRASKLLLIAAPELNPPDRYAGAVKLDLICARRDEKHISALARQE